ncbi:O-antigen ligase family protein [Coraliomargarita algicola]|uniref:O-antigen ligase family protein n=1 Tax=Coraliomargarita algicola TaxID=3092156 RepID=A0ABZ0RE28_9BACT|nr:O-antigen ligase family protein [Coraliomargarita sp. J2-16]WPJ94241.1 O-antigen ligase family protein [Coraliomargarita sp. J2-16]
MEPSSAKHRRHSLKRRHMGPPAKGARKHASSKRVAPTESFAPPPVASRRMISLPKPPGPPPAFKLFLGAFLSVMLLIALGGGYNAVALAFALLLPGIALVIKPPSKGLGKLGDFGFVGLLLCLLLAFVPQFYWPSAAWREEAAALGIDLPATLSVQPWLSFEAWLLTLAGFGWLYAALQWPVNLSGRRWLYFGLSILVCGLAGFVLWGNLMGARYPAAGEVAVFSYFKDPKLTASLLAIAGIATFIYSIEGLRSRNLVPLIGVPATVLCFAGLLVSGACVGLLLYFSGIALWFVCSIRSRSLPRAFKFGFPLVVLIFGVVLVNNDRSVQRMLDLVRTDTQLNDRLRLPVYADATDMVLAAPLSGFGLGSFSAVFPQYREASANFQTVAQPKSDLLWLASEGGLLALVFFAIFLFAYAKRCRGMLEGASASYRLLALIAVIIFALNGLFDVPWHRPGTMYFAILLAALALPTRTRAATHLPKLFWRASGALLILFGLLWLAAGLFNAPFYSAVKLSQAQATLEAQLSEGTKPPERPSEADFANATAVADSWVAQRPLDWRAYSLRAQLRLQDTRDLEQADADFRRARFVEPVLGVVSQAEGRAWLPYDPERVVGAWRETLLREIEDKDRTYSSMLQQASESSRLQERMARLSEVDPYYRAFFLCSLRGRELQREMARELAKDAGLKAYNVKLRTEIVENWIQHGDLNLAEAFLQSYEDSLANRWWLWSLLLKDQAKFQQAIQQIREHVEVPEIPAVKVNLEEVSMARLTREYAVDSGDRMKGATLISIYLEGQEYEKALSVLDRLLETPQPPLYLYYWRAECLYQLQDYIESWYSFEKYLERLWGRDDAANPVAQGS